MLRLLSAKKHLLFLALFLSLGTYLRFFNLDWDQGHSHHPDERNIASAVARISFFDNLNPEFFAYNGLPIYLYRATGEVVAKTTQNDRWIKDWGKISLIGRHYSAFFSSISLILVYIVGKRVFNKKVGIVAVLLAAFSPSLIQTAHYAVTESLLVFWALLITYLSLGLYKNPKGQKLFLTSLVCGLSLATKTSAITLLIVPILSYLPHLKSKKPLKSLILPLGFVVTALLFFGLFSPYNFLSWQKYMESMDYEGGIVNGKLKVVYVLQFLKTYPYWFHFKNLFWQLGPTLALTAIVGLFASWIYSIKTQSKKLFIFLTWPTIYLLIVGGWYAKFVRYLVPALPFLCLLSAWLIVWLEKKRYSFSKLLFATVSLSTILWGIAFFNLYQGQSTRLTASAWIFENAKDKDLILNEHWDDGLPLRFESQPFPEKDFTRENIEIYEKDDQAKVDHLSKMLAKGDWLTLSSRRLWGTVTKLPERYPLTSKYYQLLFEEKLGYKLVKEVYSYPKIWNVKVPTNLAEETLQVYDHPHIYIFKNTESFKESDYKKILNNFPPPRKINHFNQAVKTSWVFVWLLIFFVSLKLLPQDFVKSFFKKITSILKESKAAKKEESKFKKSELLILVLILISSFFIRTLRLSNNPPGFFCDEAANGYNAYQILKTGKDEFGKTLPLFFQSFGDYKNAVYIYSLVPFVFFGGLSEFTVRLSSAVWGGLAVLLIYLFYRRFIDKNTATWAALIMALMPWHIHFSRIGFQLISFPTLFLLGLYLYSKKSSRPIYQVLSAVVWGANLYTYYAAKAFVPVFVVALTAFDFFKKRDFKKSLVSLSVFLLTALPALVFLTNPKGLSRWQQTTIFNKPIPVSQKVSSVFNSYLSYYSPSFLFSRGQNSFINRHDLKNHGMLYWSMLPFLTLGLAELFVLKKQKRFLVLLMLALFPFPAALTVDSPSPNRAIIGTISFSILFGLGIKALYRLKIKPRLVNLSLLITLTLSFLIYSNKYFNQYPNYAADYWGWQYGPKEVISYFKDHQEEYDELILFHQFNAPYIFLKFYDPKNTCPNCKVGGIDGFDSSKKQLFSLTPEVANKVAVKTIHKTIRYPNNEVAFYILEIENLKNTDEK